MKLSTLVTDIAPAVLRAQWHFRRANRIGSRARVWGHPVVANHGTLTIGERLRVVSTMAPVEIRVLEGGRLEIGDDVYINYGCSIGASLLVRIGTGCRIGTHVTIIDNDFHSTDPDRRDEVPPSAPIVIEDQVWLGLRAIVLRGVTIGRGSIIGAGSVVTRDVPPRTLAAGVPAKVLRSL